jgi:hypothetical protein
MIRCQIICLPLLLVIVISVRVVTFFCLCSGSSISATAFRTAATDDGIVYRIVGNGYKISGKARSDTIVTAVSVSESRRNNKWPNYVGKEGVGPQSCCLAANSCCSDSRVVPLHCTCESASPDTTTVLEVLFRLSLSSIA